MQNCYSYLEVVRPESKNKKTDPKIYTDNGASENVSQF